MKYIYPAIFEYDENEEMAVSVSFPDIFGGVTCGKNDADAVFMAKDLLSLMLKNSPAQCENPSTFEDTVKMFPGKKIVMVEVDI